MNNKYFNLIYMGGIILSYNIGFYTHKLYKTKLNGVMKNNEQKLKQINNDVDSNYDFHDDMIEH